MRELDCRMFESHASFAADFIHAAVSCLASGDSKEALRCIEDAERKLRDMRNALGDVGA
jgi:hypothetical protein